MLKMFINRSPYASFSFEGLEMRTLPSLPTNGGHLCCDYNLFHPRHAFLSGEDAALPALVLFDNGIPETFPGDILEAKATSSWVNGELKKVTRSIKGS